MYYVDRVEIAFEEERKSTWEFTGRTVRGIEYQYRVIDLNFSNRREWVFVIRVPGASARDAYIGVNPITIPNRKRWAGLDRRSIQFKRFGRTGERVFAKLSISDVTLERNRKVLSWWQRDHLPRWLSAFRPRRKKAVVPKAGVDGDALVTVARADDHPQMIRLFLALKAWVLSDGYDPTDPSAQRREFARRRLKLRQNRSLGGLGVAVTGRLGYGTRVSVFRWLRKHRAIPKADVSSRTDLLIVGAHILGDERQKIRLARNHQVEMLSEAGFRRRFSV